MLVAAMRHSSFPHASISSLNTTPFLPTENSHMISPLPVSSLLNAPTSESNSTPSSFSSSTSLLFSGSSPDNFDTNGAVNPSIGSSKGHPAGLDTEVYAPAPFHLGLPPASLHGNGLRFQTSLSTATHEMLVQAGNPAYCQLYSAYMSMANETKFSTKVLNELLDIKAMIKSYPEKEAVAQSRNTPMLPMAIVFQQLEYETFKNETKWWYLDDWRRSQTDSTGDTQISGTNSKAKMTLFAYLEDGDGKLPNHTVLQDLRRDARDIFRAFVRDGNPPKSWGNDALLAQRDRFRQEMEVRHPLLRYCENGWKSSQTAVVLYPAFKSNEKRKCVKARQALPNWLDDGKADEDGNELDGLDSDSGEANHHMHTGKRKSPSQPTIASVSLSSSRQAKRRKVLDIGDPLDTARETSRSTNATAGVVVSEDASLTDENGSASLAQRPEVVGVGAQLNQSANDSDGSSVPTLSSRTALSSGDPQDPKLHSSGSGPTAAEAPHSNSSVGLATSSDLLVARPALFHPRSNNIERRGAAFLPQLPTSITAQTPQVAPASLPLQDASVGGEDRDIGRPATKVLPRPLGTDLPKLPPTAGAPTTVEPSTRRPRAHVPGKTHNIRNVCGRRWKKDNPKGTTTQFNAHFENCQQDATLMELLRDEVRKLAQGSGGGIELPTGASES
ncbi:hypothetical protein BC835DRAFT_1422451 [Cytidiella melzeri]|nr:hypothetical protein BC835DRAFT_1422451 [Cytidiella melzeri]